MSAVVGEARSATGRVVSRKSDRSLTNPRSAVAPTGRDDVNVNVPVMVDPPLKGASSRNRAIWPFAGIVVLLSPNLAPFWSVKKKEIVTVWGLGFAIASPVRTAP